MKYLNLTDRKKYLVVPNFLTEEQCDNIVAEIKSLRSNEKLVEENQVSYQKCKYENGEVPFDKDGINNITDNTYFTAKAFPKIKPIYKNLVEKVSKHYAFKPIHLKNRLFFMTNYFPGYHQDLHFDGEYTFYDGWSMNYSDEDKHIWLNKRMTCVVQLNNYEDYNSEGGFSFCDEVQKHFADKFPDYSKKGSLLCFPSGEWHKVLPFTKGERHTLIIFLHGTEDYSNAKKFDSVWKS
jgi:predicted 2-oxoglutarate/Fe(II)-dependent dioxygenase YbiX